MMRLIRLPHASITGSELLFTYLTVLSIYIFLFFETQKRLIKNTPSDTRNSCLGERSEPLKTKKDIEIKNL